MEINFGGDRKDARDALAVHFPKHTAEEVARAAGALDGSSVLFSGHPHSHLFVQVTHPHLHTTRIFQWITPRTGKPFLSVEHANQEAHPQIRGQGHERFKEVLRRLKGVGVRHITVAAAAGDWGKKQAGGDSGYYVWPRYGFNGRLESHHLQALPPELVAKMKAAGKLDLHTLMAIPGAAAAWERAGSDVDNLHFDLRDGSEHQKRFEEYYRDRQQRTRGDDSGVRKVGGRSDAAGSGSRASAGNAAGTDSATAGGSGMDTVAKYSSDYAQALAGVRHGFVRNPLATKSAIEVREYTPVHINGDNWVWFQKRVLGRFPSVASVRANHPHLENASDLHNRHLTEQEKRQLGINMAEVESKEPAEEVSHDYPLKFSAALS